MLKADDRFLAIETSCDDTCAAVLRGDGTILSTVVSSPGIHADYAGWVPEWRVVTVLVSKRRTWAYNKR